MRLRFWRREPSAPPHIPVDAMLHVKQLPEVTHRIVRDMPPRPTMIQPIILNHEGQEYRTTPINCSYRHTVPVYFPLSWVTGRSADMAHQMGFRLDLDY